jgi:CheY-like chemotaxis protein
MTSPRILVADHNPPISEVIKVILEAGGYGVTVVDSSEQALIQGTPLRPQLLLIDPIMPGISGVEVATRLSSETNCKVLFVTAFADDADFKEMVRGLQKQGCEAGILPKPFEKDQLLESVRRKIGPPTKDTVEAGGAGYTVGTAQPRANPSAENREFTPYERLREIATINLYQANAFRIAGLSVDTSLRDVSKEAEKLELMLRLGRTPPPASIFPLDDAPTIESVRNALQSLKDPESRLLQEFFWFWPCNGDHASDPALIALRERKYEAAVIWWTNIKGPATGIAIHNLAVFHHFGALTSAFRGSKSLQPTAVEEIHLWRSAYRHWKALLDRTDFWEELAARTRRINDPRLTIETTQRIWETLPTAIVKINAQIAAAAAERGEFEEAAKHRKLMYTSAFGEGRATAEMRRALSHTKDELDQLCENAEKEGRSTPKTANLTTRKLFDEKSRLLRAFNFLLGTGDSMRDAAHDRVAEAGRLCMVQYANATDDWEVARLVFEECLALAEGKALRLKLEEDLEIIGRNLVGQRQQQSSQQKAATQTSTPAANRRTVVPVAAPKPRIKNKYKYAAIIFVSAVVVFASVRGPSDSGTPVQPASPQGVVQSTPSEPVSQPGSGYGDSSSQQEPSSFGGTSTTRGDLKAETEADRRTLDVMNSELKSAGSSVDEYDALLNADKSTLDRMKRDNDAGIEVDKSSYETTLRRYNANVSMYNYLLSEYKAKAARYNNLLATTNAKIDRYNSQGGTR